MISEYSSLRYNARVSNIDRVCHMIIYAILESHKLIKDYNNDKYQEVNLCF